MAGVLRSNQQVFCNSTMASVKALRPNPPHTGNFPFE